MFPSSPDQVTTRKPPEEVSALRAGLREALATVCANGQKVGDCTYGVYVFYDYDGEPIYVGQTWEKIRTRIMRHLTNQRTDAVAMNVLDPFEVAEIEMWPFWGLHDAKKTAEDENTKKKVKAAATETMDRAEYTVFCQAVEKSAFSKILNEKDPPPKEKIELPPSIRETILPPDIRRQRQHPDVRIARRARTIADLARVISERQVNIGLRHTFLAQAQRLEDLASRRLEGLGGSKP